MDDAKTPDPDRLPDDLDPIVPIDDESDDQPSDPEPEEDDK